MVDKAISELSAGSALTGSEDIPMTQGGTTVRTTPDAIGDRLLARSEIAELIRDTIGSTLVAGTNVTIVVDDSPNTITISASGGGGGGFNAITSGSNTTAAMVVGSGASLSATGSGTIHATTADALHTARTIGGVSFDGSANITVATATGGFTVSGGNLALGANSLTMTGSLGATGARITKGWFTDIESTNAIVGSVTGNAATATALQNARTIGGTSFNGTANITVASATGGFAVSGGNLTVAGTTTITSSNAQAFTAGRQGATSPAFTVDASTGSSITGLTVKAAASGGGVSLTATGSATENMTYATAGSASHIFQTNGVTRFTLSGNQQTWAPTIKTGTAASTWSWTGNTNSTLVASWDVHSIYWNMAATQSFNTGAKTLQRDFRITGTSYLAVAASVVTDGATFAVDGAPVASTNITMTNSSTIYSGGANVGSSVTNSYGLNITANTGATNNYAARLAGGAVYLVDITAPSATPATGGFLYSESGALKYKGSSGTVTTVAPA